jgi:hypothetical protein
MPSTAVIAPGAIPNGWSFHPRRWPGIAFALLVILLAATHALVPLFPFGTAVYMRPALALIGLAGAFFLLAGVGLWRILLPLWCILQTCIIATDPSREWFYQGVMCGQWTTSSSMMNHQLTQYRVSGVNFAGPVLLISVLALIALRLHPPIRWRFRWTFRKALVTALACAAVTTAIIAFEAYQQNQQKNALFVIDLDAPHVPLYYQGQLLGHTPLCITPQLIRDAKMPLDPNKPVKFDFVGWTESVCLTDGITSVPLYAGVPWGFGNYADPFQSPWGERCRIHVGGEDGNRRFGQLFPKPELRGDPILSISSPTLLVHAGTPLHLHCVLSNPTPIDYVGKEADLTRHFFSFEKRTNALPPSNLRRIAVMPASWDHLPPDATLTADVEYDAPAAPGEYELFCDWFLTNSQNSGAGSTYSNILRLTVIP